MNTEDKMKIMQELEQRKTTHACPECSVMTYCAMEAGKSANLCWCMYENAAEELDHYNTCVCKNCLSKENHK